MGKNRKIKRYVPFFTEEKTTPPGVRDYKHEYEIYHGTDEQKANRAARGRARYHSCLKVGDPREIDHIKSIGNGGTNDKENLRIVSRHTNRTKGRNG